MEIFETIFKTYCMSNSRKIGMTSLIFLLRIIGLPARSSLLRVLLFALKKYKESLIFFFSCVQIFCGLYWVFVKKRKKVLALKSGIPMLF